MTVIKPHFEGIVPYLFYDDAAQALEWYSDIFGFTELGRWHNAAGAVQNAEMQAGTSEIWLDGGGRALFPKAGDERPQWLGIWVSDVDAMYLQLQDKGITAQAPVTREFGVRMLNVPDPFGYLWGFVRRL